MSKYLLFPLALAPLIATIPVNAQVTPDNSLGTQSSIVNPNVTVKDAVADLISGGAVRGNNLFHSFGEFNVGDGARVYFANPDGIANILTRVTGSNLSQINGTLGVDGGANLFILNPNGIVFGENAALDINGSFLATTGDSYRFSNGFEYSATNPETPPLLTVNLPVGVQMGTTAQPIVNRSQTMGEFGSPVGLQVLSENNLTLVGGDITLESGFITAPSGRIELGSVAPDSFMAIAPHLENWTLDYSSVNNFQDIKLNQGAVINTGGDGAGDIQIQGNNIELSSGSNIFALNFGRQTSGKVILKANDLKINGTAAGDFAASGIFSLMENPEEVGNSGDIIIETNNLTLDNDARIFSGTQGIGDSGNIFIKTNNLDLKGSLITSQTIGLGNAGDINIDAKTLQIRDQAAQISSIAWARGDAGNLNIKASESIEISGIGLFSLPGEELPQLFNSGLLAGVELGATGNGGTITVDTKELNIFAGGKITANTAGEGDAGDIIIRADNLSVKDNVVNRFDDPSGITSTVNLPGVGDGGTIKIISNNLSLIDGGLIATNSYSQGNAGSIDIQAQNINITGVSSDEPISRIPQKSLPSSISALSEGNYDAGSIDIKTNNLNLSNQGKISVSNLGNGNSGNLNITAQELNLNNSATLEAQVNAGNQGNINLTTDNIFLNNQSQITATATGTATGGNITIDNSKLILVRNNSNIIANAVFGSGGNINISTELIFIDLSSKIDASSKFGLDGVVEIQSPESTTKLNEATLPDNILALGELITVSCASDNQNSLAVTGNGGIPNSPYQTQSLHTTWYDLRPVKQDKTTTISVPKPIKEATATMVNSQGELELVSLTPLPTHRWVESSCSKVK